MHKIAIFDTALGSSNLGDEIIFDSIKRNMYEQFNMGTAFRLATHVNNFSAKQMVRHSNKIRYFQDSDWKFICGTNLIAQKRIGKINSQWQLYPSNLSIYKNCILIGVGTTEGNENLDPYAKFLYKSVLSKKYIHSVRDDLTKNIIESLGCKAINTGCPTLWELNKEHCEKIPTNKSQSCIVSVSGYKTQLNREQDQKMLDIILSNYNNLWAWIQTTEDETYLETLRGNKSLKRLYSVAAFRKVLKQGNVDYIGTRLHGGIFALQNYCRAIIISIDHRAEGFKKSNNIPALKREDISASLNNMINSSWKTDIRINEQAIEQFKSQFVK